MSSYKISKSNIIVLTIIALLILQRFIEPEPFFIVTAFIVMILHLLKRANPFKSDVFLHFLAILFFGLFIGVLSIQIYGYRDFSRDIFYVLNPLSFYLLGTVIFSYLSVNDFKKVFVLGGVYTSILLILDKIFNFKYLSWQHGYIILAISFIIMINAKSTILKKCLYMLVIVIAIAVSDSRTTMVAITLMCIVMLLNSLKNKKLKQNSLIYIYFVLFIIIIGFLAIGNDWLISFMTRVWEEISLNNDWNQTSVIVNNWRGFENYKAVEKLLQSDIKTVLLGNGFGYSLYVGEYSYLVGPTNGFLPVLHNGYLTILLKNGVLGLMMLFLILVKFNSISKRLINNGEYASATLTKGLLLVLVFITFVVTGIFKSTSYIEILMIFGFFDLYTKKKQNQFT